MHGGAKGEHAPRAREQQAVVGAAIDGTQVLWKHYRKKQGNEDVVKFCFGKVLPESQWQTQKIPHATVNACTTKAALASAVFLFISVVLVFYFFLRRIFRLLIILARLGLSKLKWAPFQKQTAAA